MQNTNRHPHGLYFLCMTEFWERFGFYVIQSLFILYIIAKFNFSDAESYNLLGAFTALVYITPVIGGYIADNIIGYRQSILFGGILLCIGYASLTVNSLTVFYIALAIIIVGNGFFKPNITGLLGRLYPKDHPVIRDAGFTIFFMGINLGGFAAGITAGLLKKYVGWDSSFYAASLGLIISLITFAIGLKNYRAASSPPTLLTYKNKLIQFLHFKTVVILIALALVYPIMLLLRYEALDNLIFLIITVGLAFYIIWRGLALESKQRWQLYASFFVILLATFYWMFDFQIFFSVNLFVKRIIDRTVFGWQAPAAFYIGMAPLFIVLCGFITGKLWYFLDKHNMNPSPIFKLGCSITFASLAFVSLIIGTRVAGFGHHVNMIWVFVCYICLAFAELFLSPISLAMITKFVPRNMVGMMIGAWFVYTGGIAGQFAGKLADISAIPQHVTKLATMQHIYVHAFSIYALIALGFAVLVFILTPVISKLF